MKLVLNPHSFDVMVMENLFGDIVSDLTAGLVGGLGLAPALMSATASLFRSGSRLGPRHRWQGYRESHGHHSQRRADVALLGEKDAADRIENAIRTVFTQGTTKTGDLGGTATTDEFVDAVLKAMN